MPIVSEQEKQEIDNKAKRFAASIMGPVSAHLPVFIFLLLVMCGIAEFFVMSGYFR